MLLTLNFEISLVTFVKVFCTRTFEEKGFFTRDVILGRFFFKKGANKLPYVDKFSRG